MLGIANKIPFDCLEGIFCDSFEDGKTTGQGDLVITEIMPAPSVTTSEWFELKNVTAVSLSLTDCTIADEVTQHIIAGELTVAAGGRVLFARDGNSASNGGITGVDYVYSDIILNNTGDSIT